jgi:GNAT superfamily N-acetyltransferase
VATITQALPGTPSAATIVRAYMTEVASRYYGRPATQAEIDQALREEPYDDLAGETGVFFIAIREEKPVACAGARFTATAAELTKVFTQPAQRGRGIGRQLIGRVEAAARDLGLSSVRLDTRSELAEACALYERLGFRQVPAFNEEPYSDRWYSKSLTP